MKKEVCLINRATVEDADILAALAKRTYLQYFSSLWGTTQLQSYLSEHFAPDLLAAQLAETQYHGFLIASIAARTVGYVKINWQQDDPVTGRPGAELQSLFVDSPLTSRGIGTRLLKSSLILAREQEEDELWVQVLSDNEAALRFYRRHGFATIGLLPFSTDIMQTNLEIMIFNLASAGGPVSG